MKSKNINQATSWFEVLQTTDRSQTAMMTLPPGEASGDPAEAHEKSDQVLLLLEGELEGEIGGELATFQSGDFVTIPAGVKHRFRNRGPTPARAFNVYSPPAYPAGTKD